jgi:hypothetical protein
MKKIASRLMGPVDFFHPFKVSERYHLYIIQAVTFLYIAYRFSSRDYGAYGLLPDSAFTYPRSILYELWPFQLSYLTTFQFIYYLVPRPSPEIIHFLQNTMVCSGLLGFFGVFPRFNATFCFILSAHFIGLMVSSNADIDGGTLVTMSLLILSLTRTGALYNFWRQRKFSEKSVQYRWPVFLFISMISFYYGLAGLNKLIDIGPHWPFVLNLENHGFNYFGLSFFKTWRYSEPELLKFISTYPLFSDIGGIVSLTGELFFGLILFFKRLRWFFVFSMIFLHVMVFYAMGINFIGNSFLIILCLDWNSIMKSFFNLLNLNRHSEPSKNGL